MKSVLLLHIKSRVIGLDVVTQYFVKLFLEIQIFNYAA